MVSVSGSLVLQNLLFCQCFIYVSIYVCMCSRQQVCCELHIAFHGADGGVASVGVNFVVNFEPLLSPTWPQRHAVLSTGS